MSRRNRKAAARRAGVAYLEALAAGLLLATLLGCALRFERAARDQLFVTRSERTAAWGAALRGCARREGELYEAALAASALTPSATRERLHRAAWHDLELPRDSSTVICNEPPARASWPGSNDVTHLIRQLSAGGERP